MKKPTYTHYWTFVLVLLLSLPLFAQDFVDFRARFNRTVSGDIVLIGNNILGPDNNAFNDDDRFNDDVDMRYIDIDSDASTFSSSSADLTIPNPNCFEIIHAGLYWSAVNAGTAPIDQVLLRGPSGGYNSITGEVIFDTNATGSNGNSGTSVDGGNSFPYACYADVTTIVRGLTNTIGTYTVANVSSAEGRTADFSNFTGHSAGWSLFIVYEDPTVTGRLITSFDGFSAISLSNNPTLDVPVSGFQTIPVGPVRASFAFAALEGDSPIRGDQLRLNGVNLSAPDRPGTPGPFPPPLDGLFANFNFFNSTISQPGGLPFNNRNPNSTNTLGFDTGIITVPNPSNTVIANGDTSATVRLQTTGDTYFPYFYALSVDIIQPKIVLTKLVEDTSGNDIEGDLVGLGDELNYIISFQNTGNDDATNFTIRDVLPVNIEFDINNDIEFLPPGVTVQSYNPATRELVFAVENDVIEVGDAEQSIRFRVRVVSDCSLLTDACSNIVENQAFSTYQGTLNTEFTLSDDPSFNTNTGCLLIPSSTNFLADLNCTFEEDVVLCGDTTVLTAANGYDSYSWSTSPTGTPVIGTTQSITVDATGTFYSFNTAVAPCQSITQEYNVTLFAADDTDPILQFADQVVTCPDDGEQLSNIFLCGASDSRFFQTNITDTSSIIWEILDENSCTAVSNPNCANTSTSCTWNQVETGPNYLVDTAGQYRLTLNYAGGCFSQFYFNVFQNLLTPTVDATDIICTTLGQIVVGNVPSNYEYSIDGTNYQASNTFSVNTPGVYTVTTRQIGVTPNPCIFTVPNVQIRERDVELDIETTQPLCSDELGEIRATLLDADAQYTFSLAQGGTVINTVGPISANNFTFENLTGGNYTVTATSEDGCLETANVTITVPDLLEATSALTTPLTQCNTGEITITATGGTAPYFYFVNGNATFQNSPIVGIPTSGTYTIRVVDSNNCEADTTIDVEGVEPPVFTINKTDVLCANNPNSGSIVVNVSNANGNTIRYSIDNGSTFQTSNTFTNLGNNRRYNVVLEYTINGVTCFTDPEEVIIDVIPQLTGNANLTTPYTCTTNGEITVNGLQNGTPPYEFSIDGVNFQTGTVFSGLVNGTFTVTIRDANLCTITTRPITILPLDPPTDLSFTQSALECPELTSDVRVTVEAGGRPSFEYRIIAPSSAVTPYQNSRNFRDLTPGIYTFEVRDGDNCTYSESLNIAPLPEITIVAETVNEISCFNETDGAIRFTVSGTDNFDYEITLAGTRIDDATITGAAPNVINTTNLGEGTYQILVTNNDTNCTQTASTTVAPAPSQVTVSAAATPITCATDGTVTVTANGGSGGYRYQLEQPDASVLPFQSGNAFTGLSQPGTYTVTVEDANGCDVSTTFDLSTPTNPTATLDATSDQCFDAVNGATIVVNASGGTPPYEYSLNGGAFDSSNTFTNLAPNAYSVVVRDAFGCTTTTPVTLTIAPQLTIAPEVTKGLDCTTSPEAEITGTITGGTAPFTYDVNIGGSGFSGTPIAVTGTTFIYTAATADTYQFLITDANNCTVESSAVTVAPITTPTASELVVNPLCNGDVNGSIELLPSGGQEPYSIEFNGGASSTVFAYTGLAAGSYPYVITDANSCTFSGTVTLSQPTPLAATATAAPFSCSASNTSQSGSVTINAPSGGTTPYLYSFNGSGFSANNVLTVDDNGADQTITWEVRDANGCTVNGSETLTRLNPPAITSITNAPPVTCTTTTSDVTVNVTPGTGVGTLSYEITAPSGAVTTNTTGTFSGLVPDTYVFRVTDDTGCFVTESYTVAPVTPIAVTGAVLSNVGCRGESTGAIRYTVSGVSGGGYTISGFSPAGGTTLQSGNTIDITGLPVGTYTLEVTDNTTNCTDDVAVTITEPATALSATASSTPVFCTDDESQITVTATGGTPSYRYAAVLNGASAPAPGAYVTTNVLTVDTNSGADLVWDVYVADANNCVFNTTVTIVDNGTPTVTTPTLASNQCTATTAYTFTATGSGGLAPLEYSINGVAFQSSPTFTVNAAGSYTVTVRDANGCTATSSTTTDVFEPLNANAVLTKDLTCAAISPTDATIDVTTFGGSNDFTIEQSINGAAFTTLTSTFAGGTFMVTTGTDGDYQFRITDNTTNCSVLTNVVTVTPTVLVTASEVHVDPTCNGFNDGTITLTPTGGEAPFQYSLNGGTFVTSNVFGGLVAATYTFIVRDARGCEANVVVTLDNPPPIDVTLTSTGIVCNVNTLGSFTATINSGGVSDFVYTLFDRNSNQLATSGPTAATTHTFPGLTFGDYIITIVDDNGCEYNSGLQRINTPPILNLTGFVDSNTCSSGVDYTVRTSGGVPDYIFSIFGQPGTASPPQTSDTFTFTGLLHNTTYFLQVQDVNNCISVLEITTPAAPSTIAISGTTPRDVTCNGADNGSLDFTVENYDPTVTDINFEVLDQLTLNPVAPAINGTLSGAAGGPVSSSITGLSSGTYVLQVREATGTECPASFSFTITQPIQSVTASITSNIPANCNADAQVRVTATGGTPGYIYAAGAPGFTPVPGDFGTNNVLVLDPNTRTTWDIVVEDTNGCQFTLPVTITETSDPTINTIDQQCYVGTPLNITLSGTVAVGTPTYSLGGAFQISPNFTVNGPGSYTATIRDTNGCTAQTTLVVAPQVFLNANLTQDLDCTASASITLTATGGTGIYGAFEVSFNGGAFGAATSPFTTAVAGDYQFRVFDNQATPASGCPALSDVITVTPNTTPTLTETHADVTCNGDTNGSIVVTAANGIAPYQYSINGGAFQAANTFTGLAPATYDIQVRDSKNCTSAVAQVTIDEPTAVTGTTSATVLTCGTNNATQSATITVTGSGGTSPYTYSFDNGVNFSSSNTFTTNVAGNVDIVVRDVNGCLSTTIVETIAPLDPPTDLDFSATTVTCSATTSDVSLTATGGVGTLSYAILAPASATGNTTGAASGTFTGLAPDTYLFEVTDANSCTYEEAFTVIPVTNITVSGQLINALTCNGGSDGAVTFTVGDFTGTYSYSITGVTPAGPITGQSASSIALTALPTGAQTITVTDDITNCTATATIVVPEPSPVTVGVDTLENANCNEGAFVQITGSGGTPGYTYAFVVSGNPAPAVGDYSTSNSTFLDPATSMNWDAYVRDSNGCTGFRLIRIAIDPLPTITLPIFAANQCNTTGDAYTFSVATSSGQGTLEYALDTSGAFSTNTTFTVSVPSVPTDHSVTVRDENGCTATATIRVYPPLSLATTIEALPSCIEGDGEITVAGTGGSGTANYSYVITAPASATSNSTGATTGEFTGLDSGTYTFEITDGITTCTNQATIDLTAATPVTFDTPVIVNVSCNAEVDGSITVNLAALPSNDNPIYQYEIISGIPTQGRPAITRPQQTSNIFDNLPAGDYTIRVTSGRACTEEQTVTITEPVELAVTATATDFACAPDNTVRRSTITVTETAGTGTSPYRYSIDGTNYFTTNTFDVSDTGTVQNITVFVRDTNGCEATNTVTINPLPTITAAPVSVVTPIDCNGTGSVAVNVTGGSGNFTYELLPGAAQASNTFPITDPGTYFFRVNDIDTGCFFETDITIAPFDNATITLIATNDVTCFNDGLGTFDLNVANYVGAYTYEVFDSSNTSIRGPIAANTTTNPVSITGLSGGTYRVDVIQTDSPFCTTMSNVVTIESPSSALTLSLFETANVTCDNDKGAIRAEALGGQTPYEYQLINATTSVVVETFSANAVFTDLSDLIASPRRPDYIVTVRDARGCEVSESIDLEQPTPILTTITATPLLDCFNDADGTVEVAIPTGGQGSNYVYTLNQLAPTIGTSGPQTSRTFNNLSAGTYSVTVTDGYNCTFTTGSEVIAQPDQVRAELELVTAFACGVDARINLTAFGGTAPYQYTRIFDNDDDENTPPIATTPAGTITAANSPLEIIIPEGQGGDYQFSITDANGCVSILSNQVTLLDIPPLTVNIDRVTNSLCFGSSEGEITARALGGVGNYVYTLEEVDGANVLIREVDQNTTGIFTTLSASRYRVRVDSDSCRETGSVVEILESDEIQIDSVIISVSCAGDNTGRIELNVTGGSGTFIFAISPRLDQFVPENIFENLVAGSYDVVIQDDQTGCFVFETYVVGEPAPIGLTVVDNSIVPELCAGDANGAFDVQLSGGSLPYRVSVDSNEESDFTTGTDTQTTFNFSGLSGGNHTVFIIDVNDCTVDFEIDFPFSVDLTAELVVDYGCEDNLSTNTVTVNLQDLSVNPADVSYALDGGPSQESNVFFNVAPGLDHFIEVTHVNGCSVRAISVETLEDVFDIDTIEPLTLTLEEGRINEIIANAAGGTGNYEFTFNDESTGSENSYFIFETGVYTVVVTDSNGCTATASIPLEFIDICIPNVFIPGNQEGFGPGCADQYENLELDIFDRYGRKIATIDINTTWDGTYNGKELPTGDYWYIVKLNDERDDREFVGHFTLYR